MAKPIGYDPQIDEAVQKLISLSDASEFSGLSKTHVRLLVRQQIIWGVKIGRNWLTTKEAIEAYLETEQKTGRPRGATRISKSHD